MSQRKGRTAPSLGIDWFLPRPDGGYEKRRFATTTKASAALIELLAEDGSTWDEIAKTILYDPEARAVAQHFTACGFADIRARTMLSGFAEGPNSSTPATSVP